MKLRKTVVDRLHRTIDGLASGESRAIIAVRAGRSALLPGQKPGVGIETVMWRRAFIPMFLASLLTAAGVATAQQNQKPSSDDPQLTLEQIRALVARAIAHQHADDRELAVYDRVEHTIQREGGKDAASTDAVEHVFPTGTGDVRVTLNRNGKPVEAMAVEEQWRYIEKALQVRAHPDDPAIRDEFQRQGRRELAHAEMVESVGKAFHFRCQGRVTLAGRPMIELTFEPDTSFRSSARFAAIFAHTGGTVWVDEASGQVARLEADLREDVGFGGGIIAKIYRGSRLTVTQTEVAPGVWFPAVATYDIEGRKFLFAASWRGEINATGYRRVGPPAEALGVVQRELQGVVSSER